MGQTDDIKIQHYANGPSGRHDNRILIYIKPRLVSDE